MRPALARHALSLLVAVTLGACATSATAPPPTPAPPPASAEPDAPAAPPPAAPAPDTTSATVALLRQSERAEHSGALLEAIAYTERAIRISPRQADLWIRRAALELAADKPANAIQYANKALSLAGSRTDWQRSAWLVIADARERQGDHDAAREIRERWRTYRG